ncbi:MAG: insulinase family protein, partial [Planctomycetes bacterium]|nr:insulinase family protein [Planctomycetota bacterium]
MKITGRQRTLCSLVFNTIGIVSIICLLFCYSNSVFAQHGAPAVPEIGKPQSKGAKIVSELKSKPLEFTPPTVERMVLDNGMILYLLEDHSLPLFHITARFRTGAIYEPAEKAGLASLTGHVMRSGGTISRTADQINEELEYIAASVETGIDRESGAASLSVLKKDVDKGIEIFADVLMNPAFPEDKIKKRKDELMESFRRENDSPGQIVFREFRKLVYDKNHPYSRRVDGEPQTIEAITRDDMIAFHKKYFMPNNVIMGISGDFNKDEIIEKLKTVFAPWEKADIAFPEVPKVVEAFQPSVNYIEKDVNQANVVFGHTGINRTNPDYFPVTIMNFILGGGSFASRIPGKIRSTEGLAYSVYSAFHTPRDLGFFFVSCQTKLETTAKAVSIAIAEIRNIKETPVDDEELELAKDTYTNQFIFKFTTSSAIVSQMVDIEYDGLPLDYLDTYVDNVKAVTKKDVLRVAKKYLHPDEMILLVVGNKEKFDKPLSE